MTDRAAPAGWYPDPHNPILMRYWDGTAWTVPSTARTPYVAGIFGRTWLYGIVIGLVTGAGSGTTVMPVLGTLVGGVLGLAVGVAIGLIVATVLAFAAQPPVSTKVYRRTVDVTLVIVGAASAALSALFGFSGDDEAIGIGTAATIFAIAVACLVLVRPRLHRLVQE